LGIELALLAEREPAEEQGVLSGAAIEQETKLSPSRARTATDVAGLMKGCNNLIEHVNLVLCFVSREPGFPCGHERRHGKG